jgi:tRNA-2-methylthio-N6-dimethylallyladenosine synthase
MNKHDSLIVLELLKRQGYEETEDPVNADLILLNTCSVRQHAENRAIGRARNLARLKSLRPGLMIGLIGCVAQSRGVSLLREAPCVDFVIGTDCYRDIPEVLERVRTSHSSVVLTEVRNFETYGDLASSRNGICSFLPIMRGCNNFCSYCIVPYTRGRERSRPADEVMSEAERLAAAGVKEITLVGQNVNSYHDGTRDFCALLRMLNAALENVRIRFLTSHPKDFGRELIETLSECENVCEHVHLPLQSGSSEILAAMNRGYTFEEYENRIESLRKKIPGVGVTTDVMVGFPGESERDFTHTLEAVNKIAFDFAYMFAYSPRGWEQASSFEDQVPEETRQERLEELIRVQKKITERKAGSLVSTDVEVLVEGESKLNPAEKTGRSRENKNIVLTGEVAAGDTVRVKIDEVRGWTPYGRVILRIDRGQRENRLEGRHT